MVSAGSSDRAALSEGGSSRRPSSVSDRRDVAHLLVCSSGTICLIRAQNWDSAAIQVRCSARAKLGYGRIAVDVVWITDEQRPFMPAKASTNHKLNIL